MTEPGASVHRMGAAALLIEVADVDQAVAWAEECRRRREAGELEVVEVVPGARTVLLDGVADPEAAAAAIATWTPRTVAQGAGSLVELEVRFDGPDLSEVATLWGVSDQSAVAMLLGVELRVAFTGFAPGFAYMTGIPAPVPRRASPRAAVPAGAVALAGEYAGVYPRRSPGGWQIVGSTDSLMFDPMRDPAALLAPGARVRFVAA